MGKLAQRSGPRGTGARFFPDKSLGTALAAALATWGAIGIPTARADLSSAVAVPDLADVCPSDRTDALCTKLREGARLGADAASAYAEARTLVRTAVTANLASAAADPAIQYFIRERTLALVAWNAVTNFGALVPKTPTELAAYIRDYPDRVDEFLDDHFRHYPSSRFPQAHVYVAPESGDSCTNQLLLLNPGVIRMMGRNEYAVQMAKVNAHLPCLKSVHVNSGTFIDPVENARQGVLALAELDAKHPGSLPIHMIGYSQGAANELMTLAMNPEIAKRTRSVITLNGASNGTPLMNFVYDAIDRLSRGLPSCSSEHALLCELATALPHAPRTMYEFIASIMSVPVDTLDAFLKAENAAVATPDLPSFLKSRKNGFRTLTTRAGDEFWTTHGSKLPQSTLYMAFRSIITDKSQNLPISSALTYLLLNWGTEYNDMQVPLPLQMLRAPVDRIAVNLPVAEGNHWQWALTHGGVPSAAMPGSMSLRVPQAALMTGMYEAMFEVGVLVRR